MISLEQVSKSQRIVGGLNLNPSEEAESRARQTEMWMRQQFHPLAESLRDFERRIADGCPRAKRNVSHVPPELLPGYQKEFELREFEKRLRLNTSDGAAEAHVDDVNVARNSKDTSSYYLNSGEM